MPINPAIALGVETPKPLDMLGAYGNAMSIKGMVDSARLRELQGAALSQKMQFDQQDQALDLAGKRITIGQKVASGLISLPPGQRAAQYPAFRQEYIRLTGDTNVPEQYDEAHVTRYALLGQDPNKMQEAIRAEAQRLRMAELTAGVNGGNRSIGMPAAPAPGQTQLVEGEGGQERLELPSYEVNQQEMTPQERAERQMMLSDLVRRDPMLAGTPFAKESLDAGINLSKEARDVEGAGISTIKGADGNTYVIKNGMIINGGRPLDTGRDPNADFWADPETGLPVPNQAALDAKQARAKASGTNLAVYPPGAIEPGKTTRTDLEKETIAASSAIQRFNQIQSALKPEFLQFAPRVSAGWAAIKEKSGATLAPGERRFLQEFSAWSRGAIEEVNTYIQQKTGAAMGVQEAQRLRKGVPDPGQGLFDGDSPTQFKAKLDDTMRQLKLVEARSLYAIRNGLSLMGPNGEPLVPLSAMPKIMDERGLQIEKQVRQQFPKLDAKELKQMVVKQLGVEFGIGSD